MYVFYISMQPELLTFRTDYYCFGTDAVELISPTVFRVPITVSRSTERKMDFQVQCSRKRIKPPLEAPDWGSPVNQNLENQVRRLKTHLLTNYTSTRVPGRIRYQQCTITEYKNFFFRQKNVRYATKQSGEDND